MDAYEYAQSHNIDIYPLHFEEAVAMSVPDHIAIDYRKVANERHEKEVLMHEISHNETGTFYGSQCPLETRQRLEFRADKWAFQHLVPIEELTIAVHQGYTEIWELAEYFDVSEPVVRKAVAYYRENGMI